MWEELRRTGCVNAGRKSNYTAENHGAAVIPGAITWHLHQWHEEYPIERKMGTSRRRASSNAFLLQTRQSTGLSACWRRYGEAAWASSFATLDHPLSGLPWASVALVDRSVWERDLPTAFARNSTRGGRLVVVSVAHVDESRWQPQLVSGDPACDPGLPVRHRAARLSR
jgi:hypothetical protein